MNAKTTIKLSNKKGRSVFSARTIKKGEEICRSFVFVLGEEESQSISGTTLDFYVFAWPKKNEKTSDKKWSLFCVAVGEASLINHSEKPNSFWSINRRERSISFYASSNIKAGEEITHNYHWPKKMTNGFE